MQRTKTWNAIYRSALSKTWQYCRPGCQSPPVSRNAASTEQALCTLTYDEPPVKSEENKPQIYVQFLHEERVEWSLNLGFLRENDYFWKITTIQAWKEWQKRNWGNNWTPFPLGLFPLHSSALISPLKRLRDRGVNVIN